MSAHNRRSTHSSLLRQVNDDDILYDRMAFNTAIRPRRGHATTNTNAHQMSMHDMSWSEDLYVPSDRRHYAIEEVRAILINAMLLQDNPSLRNISFKYRSSTTTDVDLQAAPSSLDVQMPPYSPISRSHSPVNPGS